MTAVYWATWKFSEHRSTTAALLLSKERTFALVASAIVVQTLLMRAGFAFGEGIAAQSMRAPFNDPVIWDFGIPFAAAALLVAMLVDTQLAFYDRDGDGALCRPAGSKRHTQIVLRDDCPCGRDLRHQPPSRASVGYPGRVVRRRGQRHHGLSWLPMQVTRSI